jgi:de-etiolated-1
MPMVVDPKEYCANNNSTDSCNGIVPRIIPPQNLVQRLFWRETNAKLRCRGRDAASIKRSLYTNVFPNYTVCNVEKPACFLRKFAPDGQHLVAFSADQTSLEIYEFRGPSVAAEMLHDLPASNVGGIDYLLDSVDSPAATRVRSQIFGQFFKLKGTTGVAMNGESLNRECSLFTDDGR